MKSNNKKIGRVKVVTCILSLTVLVFSCGGGGDDPAPQNLPPSQSQLIYPSENLLCIDNNITFNWNASVDPENDPVTYKITIAKDRSLTTIVEQRNTSATSVIITLEKAIAYYWRVVPTDNKGNEGDTTPVFAFYTEGPGVSNYAPFTAALVEPALDSFIDAGTTNLKWTGGDANSSDTLTYEVYFGETSDPLLIAADVVVENADVVTQPGKTYYWKVNTTDNMGAKTIGQIWKFNTN